MMNDYRQQAIELAEECNNYDGDNIWNDLILASEIDQDLTDEHDTGDSTLAVFPDEFAIKYVEMDKQWYPTTVYAVRLAMNGAGVGYIRGGLE